MLLAAPFEAYTLMNMHCFKAAERAVGMPRGDGKDVQLTAKAFLSSRTRCDVDAACSACGTDAVDANGLLRCCSDALGASRKHLKHGLDALHQADFFSARQYA